MLAKAQLLGPHGRVVDATPPLGTVALLRPTELGAARRGPIFADRSTVPGLDEASRQKMRESPPQILLTNYMMLELLLTRTRERALRDAIYEHLRFLVFDELHTYRGRQGADVAMLIRRIRSRCSHDVLCIGTSATMVSAWALPPYWGVLALRHAALGGGVWGPLALVAALGVASIVIASYAFRWFEHLARARATLSLT